MFFQLRLNCCHVLLLAVLTVAAEAYAALPENSHLLDLSHPLNSNTLHWIEDRPLEFVLKHNGTTTRGQYTIWFQSESVEMATHTGTHLDAPCHFAKGKWCVSDIPVEHLMDRPAAVVDVTKQCLRNRDYEVTVADIVNWEKEHGQLPEGGVLLIKTGWGRFWPIKEEYFGTPGSNPAETDYPGISPSTAQWLVKNRQLVGVGIEGPSIDKARSEGVQTHVILFAQNIYALENVPHGISKLPPTGATLTILPMKLESASGAPVRIIGRLSPSLCTSAALGSAPSGRYYQFTYTVVSIVLLISA